MILNENGRIVDDLLDGEVFFGIYMLAVTDNLKMYMCTRGSARITHRGYNLAFFDLFTHTYEVLVIMGVSGYITIAMADFNQVSITWMHPGPGNNTRCNSYHRRTDLPGKIQAFMKFTFTGDRICPETKK